MAKISIIGTGAYGSALANVLAKNNHQIYMYGIDINEIEDININKRNSKFFDQEFKYKNIQASNNLKEVIFGAKIVILATPSHVIESVLKQIDQVATQKINLINTSKGIECSSSKPLSQCIEKSFKNLNNLATLIGPSFAKELFEEKLSIINIVGKNETFLKEVKQIFDNDSLKLNISLFEEGLQYYAALKNVLAIGMGIIHHLYNSTNTSSAIFTIGFKEIFQIVKAIDKKINPEIIFEMAALGDTYLTSSSVKSRNFSFGISIAKEGSVNIPAQNQITLEGYLNARLIKEIIQKYDINIPLFTSIYNILYNNKQVNKILDFLN